MSFELELLNLPSIQHVIDHQLLVVPPTMLVTDVLATMVRSSDAAPNPVAVRLDRLKHFAFIVDTTSVPKPALLGIFTERDLVRLVTQRINLQGMTIAQVMTRNVITLTLSEEVTLIQALSILQANKIHYLPVFDEQLELLGAITYESIRQALEPVNLLKLRRVADVMHTVLVDAAPSSTICELAQRMYEQGVSSVVITETMHGIQRAIGIVTEQDLLRLACTDRDLTQTTAQEIMSHPVIHVEPNDSLWHVHEQMQAYNIRRLIVVGPQAELLGIVTRTCFLQALDPLEVAAVVATLQQQVADRTLALQTINQQLAQARSQLEDKVTARTADLLAINARLQQEIDEHKRTALEQKATEAALQASESLYRSVVTALHEGVMLQDCDGRILTCNQSAERILGLMQAELIDRNPHDPRWQAIREDGTTFPGDQHPSMLTLRTGHPCKDVIMGLRHSNGQLIWISINTQPLFMPNELRPYAVVTSFRDITAAKELEAQLLRAQRLESIGTLASGIAHDLNNIFTPILAAAQLLPLTEKDLAPQSQQLLEMLESSAKRGAELIKQVLSFARGTDGSKLQLNLKHIVAEVAQLCRQTFPKSIEVCVRLTGEEIWSVFADATQIHQVLMNLCVNARDAMMNGGNLTIGLENRHVDQQFVQMHLDANVGDYVVLSVHDTGMGMPPEILNRIFDPFFTTKELGQGTGLGLSTALGIIKSHHGFITVESEINQGSHFYIFLPAVQPPAESTPESAVEYPSGHGETVLLVDDEPAILQITQTLLETYQYQVLTVDNGQAAIDLYTQKSDTIDLILLDMMMPSMSGITAIQALQRINPQVKIIACSGLTTNQRSITDAGLTVQAFLPKPYSTGNLLNALAQVLQAE